MNRTEYLKQKAKNKAQVKAGAVAVHEQLLIEIQENNPAVVDFYYSEHLGTWTLLTDKGGAWVDSEHETMAEMLEFLENKANY